MLLVNYSIDGVRKETECVNASWDSNLNRLTLETIAVTHKDGSYMSKYEYITNPESFVVKEKV